MGLWSLDKLALNEQKVKLQLRVARLEKVVLQLPKAVWAKVDYQRQVLQEYVEPCWQVQ